MTSQTMITGENRFVFVAPMFNASKTLPRMLFSLLGQSYENWKLILIDDVSSAEHRDGSDTQEGYRNFISKSWLFLKNEEYHGFDQLELIENDTKRWEVANVLDGISRCENNDIICRIDADDWLTDLDALMMINAVYQKTDCDALWSSHRWGFSDKNISAPLPKGSDPYKYPWVSSHLKTFRKRLLNNVNDTNFRGEDGQYIRRAGDQAIYLPVLHNATNSVYFPRCLYHYTIDDVPETYQTTDAVFQRDEALFLRARGYVS